MDLSSVLVAFGSPAIVTRQGPATFDSHGRVQAATTSTFSLPDAVIIPLTGRDLLNLPEGERTTDSRWLYTSTELFTATQGQHEADWITCDDGLKYQVAKKIEYHILGNYWQYLLQKSGE